MQKQTQYHIKGMQRDASISKSNPEFSFENMNIRITARENNSLLSVSNEKGNKDLTDIEIKGIVLGHCVLNKYVTIFSKEEDIDYIYRLEIIDSDYSITTLYEGNLNFNTLYPIECIGVYETEDIQKIYWTDSFNQPRVINIVSKDTVISQWTDNSFNFVKSLQLKEKVEITKNNIANGIFASGVIQYVMTYFNIYGQESNVFYTSPLYYISYKNRGGSPEDKVANSFNIDIQNIDTSFDYLRIYSIQRTSEDGPPETKRIVDLSINNNTTSLSYTDTGTSGNIIDPTELLYVGGKEIIAKTMTHKDNTLFLGNIELKKKIVPRELIEGLRQYYKLSDAKVSFTQNKYLSLPNPTGTYPYESQLAFNSSQIKTFKYLEYYRFGLQFQDDTGNWSEPIFIKDVQNLLPIRSESYISQTKVYLNEGHIYLGNDNISGEPLSSLLIKKLVDAGFKKIRPVVVYPSLTDRECVCQGILCPTLYNVNDRHSNTPFAQSSWFVRPNSPFDIDRAKVYSYSGKTCEDWFQRDTIIGGSISTNSRAGVLECRRILVDYNGGFPVTSTTGTAMDSINRGAWAEFRHGFPIPSNNDRRAEIQCIWQPPATPYASFNTETDRTNWVAQNAENYYVDQSILTMHSPDIEFDTDLQNIDTTGLKLRIVGMVPITGFYGDIDIQTSTPPNNFKDSSDMAPGFYKEGIQADNISRFGWRGLMSGAFWFDEISDYKSGSNTNKNSTGFVVYPWHRNGSLNNKKWATDGYRPAMLDKKKISNIRYSYTNWYLDYQHCWKAETSNQSDPQGISGVSMFNSNEVSLLKIPSQHSLLNDINYYGNVDKVLTISRIGNKKEGYPIITTGSQNTSENSHLLFADNYTQVNTNYTDHNTGTDPVRIKYKSTPHAVLALKYTANGYQKILPTLEDGDTGYSSASTITWNVNKVTTDFVSGTLSGQSAFWDKNRVTKGVTQDVIKDCIFDSQLNGSNAGRSIEHGYLWLGELYNDNITNRFGGNTEEAYENNEWHPCGAAIDLMNPDGSPVTQIYIKATDGDTYYQRYDHLKTYPFTLEDQNAVTDIVSFMCETRVNLDGRYDRNRGQTANFAVTPSNFNKFNPVYTQKDNFFTYRGLNPDKFTVDHFPNTVTWTKEKQIGSLTDTWTNITVASTLDLDGDKGAISSLNTFNNEIFCLQTRGFSNILFNSRVQVPTSDGVPIEISNGLKVGGKRYISNTVGCLNKWSIVETSRGIYFMDNLTNAIYIFNGQLEPITDKLGFRQWIGENNQLTIWNPETFTNCIAFNDKTNDDIYFINKNTALCFSELLGQFTSFMSYEQVPAMFNLEGKFLSIKNNKIWEHNEGDYNYFYGSYKPYYMIYRVNPDTPLDKVFSSIEFRSDTWEGDKLMNTTFDKLEVWNEYQKGTAYLTNTLCQPSNLKQKFRIWRATIPRDDTNKRDRIRNPWVFLKLTKETMNTYRTEFHDLIVKYFE